MAGINGKLLGQMTPREAHQRYAWGGKHCTQEGCSLAPVVRALTFAPLKELEVNAPALLIRLAHDNKGAVPIVEFTYGKFVRIGEAFACIHHKAGMERALAHGPSWVLHEFDYGPDPVSRIVAQVPSRTG